MQQLTTTTLHAFLLARFSATHSNISHECLQTCGKKILIWRCPVQLAFIIPHQPLNYRDKKVQKTLLPNKLRNERGRYTWLVWEPAAYRSTFISRYIVGIVHRPTILPKIAIHIQSQSREQVFMRHQSGNLECRACRRVRGKIWRRYRMGSKACLDI